MSEALKSVLVQRLAARGDGITADGRFVPGAIPGDSVSNDGEVTPGPERRAPPCRHFGTCGGCQLQHASDAVIAAFAQDRILEPLGRVGLTPAELMPVHMSPPNARRRAAMRATRTNGQVRLGFNAAGAHSIVDIAECPVLHPELFRLVAPLRRLLAPHLAERSAIGVTLTLTDSGPDLLLTNLQANSLPIIEGLTAFAQEQRLARLSLEGPMGVETLIASGDPTVSMGGVTVTLPPAAFLQATADGEAALVAAVTAIVGAADPVVDLFAGAGTFTFPLARTAKVTAADGAGPAIRALETAARRAGRQVTTRHRDLFRQPFTAAELAGFGAAVIDPPRAGAAAQTDQLAQSQIPVVAAVSCNPATFARDAARLAAGGFGLQRIWPVAQFRWSTHIELVAEFRRT